MNNIGKALKAQRLAMGLSRDQLSRMTKVTPKSIKDAEDSGLPSVRTLLKLCDSLGLELRIVEKDKPRKLTDTELSIIAENIATDALNGLTRTLMSIDDETDIDIYFDAEIKQYQEIGYECGTGAWLIDDCKIKINKIEIYVDDEDVEIPDFKQLEDMVESRIMEG